MENLYQSDIQKDFYLWVNPNNFLVRHQITEVGSFFSGGNLEPRETNLMFIPNPKFKGDITPFQINMMQNYIAEYQFELCREAYFQSYPSRLNSIFLFHSEDEAQKYKKRHMGHVQGRILKKAKTCGHYLYSQHDSSWIDFLRLGHCMAPEVTNNSCKSYWQGINVEQCELQSISNPWTESPILETLFLGRIEFYDRNLEQFSKGKLVPK